MTKAPRTLSEKMLWGLVAGAAVGILLGERASFLQVGADAYIKLLQMTVLPYVTVSIIAGLGSLRAAQARTLGWRVGSLLLVLWAIALVAVFLFPLMFPSGENASFFSTALVEEREPFDFLNLYIPTNPFNALANSVVPAVVLFSVILGIALIAVPERERLLDVLAVVGQAVSKATDFVLQLAPYGVFALGAVVAGTLSLEDLGRLQVYLLTYTGVSLLLALWVLPGLVAAVTPVPYRALMSRTRDALVMAFMTTSLFAVLPMLTESAKDLLREYAPRGRVATPDEAADVVASVDVIVPASFTFPHTGKILSLSFVLFAGWFADVHVRPTDYARLATTGVFAMFGSANAAIPFLLDLFRIPDDTFRLFVTSGIVNARVGTLVAAVHTVAMAVLGTCAVTGMLKIAPRRLMRFAVVTGCLTLAIVGGTRLLLQFALHRPYEKDALLTGMRPLEDRGTPKVFRRGDDVPPLPLVAASVLDRVRQRRVVRVGYFEDSLPYVFFNARGELAGLDVEMALQLARDLGVEAEFVPVDRTILTSGLDTSLCDLVMSGVVVTTDRSLHVQFTSPYLDETVAFIVPDHLASAFSDWSTVKGMGRLRLGVPDGAYFLQKIREELGNVEEIVPIERMEDMFVPHSPPIDAFVATAERGSAYTLLHPAYSVAVPKPRPFKLPLAYVVAGRDAQLTATVNTWIEQKHDDDTIDELFAHWILGQDSAPKHPRWSVVHDVLHWL